MTEPKRPSPSKNERPEYQEIQQRLADAIKAVIRQQLETKDPPETLETFERLQEEGFGEEETHGLIGHAISREVAELVAGTGVLNLERYIEALNKLPAPFTEPKGAAPTEEDLPL